MAQGSKLRVRRSSVGWPPGPQGESKRGEWPDAGAVTAFGAKACHEARAARFRRDVATQSRPGGCPVVAVIAGIRIGQDSGWWRTPPSRCWRGGRRRPAGAVGEPEVELGMRTVPAEPHGECGCGIGSAGGSTASAEWGGAARGMGAGGLRSEQRLRQGLRPPLVRKPRACPASLQAVRGAPAVGPRHPVERWDGSPIPLLLFSPRSPAARRAARGGRPGGHGVPALPKGWGAAGTCVDGASG
jgi:hypothetical protein